MRYHSFPNKCLFVTQTNLAFIAVHIENVTVTSLQKYRNIIKRHFKNYCKVIEKRMGTCYYWSVDNSYELIDNISDRKNAQVSKHQFTIGCYIW